MHETMVAQSMFDIILEQANKYNATAVSATISCGQFNPINDDTLNFAFEVLAKGTPCEGMKLEVKHIPLKAICKNCKHEFEFDIFKAMCPECDNCEFDFAEDAELLLENIELKDPDQVRPEPNKRN